MSGGEPVGRNEELLQLDQVIERAATGGLHVALLEGEAGIGKSTLLGVIGERAAAAGFAVLHGRCDDLERERPFRAVADAFRRTPVAELLAGDAIQSPDAGHRIVDGVVDALEALALTGPVLLVLDDLQWADTDTLRIVRSSTRRLTGLPIAAVFAFRSAPRSPDLAATLDQLTRRDATQLLLAPLDGVAVAELATQVLAARCSVRLVGELARTGGNPLYVLELLASLQADGLVSVADGAADLGDAGALPPGLRHTIIRRLSVLPSTAVDLLRAASILGTAFAPGDLAVVLDRPVADLLPDLGAALDAGILVEGEDDRQQLAFRHDLIRSAVYEDVPTAVRSALHLDAAHALDAAGSAPASVAPHLDLGAERHDDATRQLLHRVARAVRYTAPAQAVRLYERALAVVTDDVLRDELLAEMAGPLTSIGRTEQAEQIARSILARSHDSALGPALREALHYALIRSGRTGDDVIELERIADSPELDEDERLVRRSDLAHALLVSGEIERAVALALDVIGPARASGDMRSVVRSQLVCITEAMCRGRVAEAVALGAETVALDHRLERRVTAEFMYGLALLDADRVDDARRVLEQGRRFEVDLGDPTAATIYYWSLAGVHYLEGRWDDALAEADAGMSFIADGVGANIGLLFPHGLRARIHLHRGDLDAADTEVATAGARLVSHGTETGVDFVLWAQALLLAARGNVEGAATVLGTVWTLLGEARYFMGWRLFGPDLARLAVEAENAAMATDVADVAAVGAERAGGVPSAEGAALRCHAIVGSDPPAAAKAAALLADSPRQVEAAWAAEDAGRLFAAAGDRAAAVPFLQDALSKWESFGALHDIARAEALLRTCGARVASRRPRRPSTGWGSLTPTETKVVELVAAGLTNPQVAEHLYVSPRTVETHLAHVFAKLSMRSRVELAAEWARRQSG